MVVKAKGGAARNEFEENYGGGIASKKRRRTLDEDDEGEEEEEDDENEDEEGRGGKRRKSRTGVARFIDDEALVSSGDEEDDDPEPPEDGFLVPPEADLGYEDIEADDRRQMYRQLPFADGNDDEQDIIDDIVTRIHERYSQIDMECDDGATEIEQQILLPSVRDPKLWMVKCAVGREREVAICLMQKCIEIGPEIQIRSAIALDNIKNYIYVEAEKEAHVKEACKGLRNLYATAITMVPMKEMTDLLSVKSKAVDLRRDTWVRLKTGIYKGDLAKVVDLDNSRQKVTLKLVPRIDLKSLANKLEGKEVPKTAIAPPSRLINSDEARELHIQVQRRFDKDTKSYYEIIGGMMFKDGFLYKTVSMKSVSTHNIQPTLNEVENFSHGVGDLATLSSLLNDGRKGHFMKGDRVVVVKGELKNLKGSVERVEKDIVYIKSNEPVILDSIAVRIEELCKYFEPGNQVKVIAGASKGATGVVVSVERHVVNIVSDATKDILCVFADYIVEASEVTADIGRIGDYTLHDLVLLQDTSFGVIVKIEHEACHVLKGAAGKPEIALVGLREIKCRLEKRYTSKDRYGNQILANDTVKILEGPNRGKQGTIKHIFKDILFLHDVHHLEHAGFICAMSHFCVLVGGSRASANRKSGSFQSRYANQSTHLLPAPSPMSSPAKVRICKGYYKGCRGVVKEVRGNTLRVELEAQMKIVTVTRHEVTEDIRNASSPFREPCRYGPGSETPVHLSLTPLRPFLTPMRDAAVTPVHDGMRTPVHDSTSSPPSLSSFFNRGLLLETV